MIKNDFFRYVPKGGNMAFVKLFLFNPSFRFICCYRTAVKYRKTFIVGTFLNILYRIVSSRFGFQIPLNTKIGKGFYIGHWGVIVINGKAEIGENVNITHGVTIGRTNRGSNKGVPIIGNDVWIGASSTIVGRITVGNNVLIAPNTFVNKDIPNDTIVFGNPMQFKYNNEATRDYINNRVI